MTRTRCGPPWPRSCRSAAGSTAWSDNAGGQYRAALKDISTNGFQAVVRNNLTGTFVMMRETYTQWMQEHGGAIVNIIADIWGGWPGMGHWGASRGGTWTLTETAACEWAESGVRVNALAPGGIASSGFDTYDEAGTRWIQEKAMPVIPLKRFGTEAEISAGIVDPLAGCRLCHGHLPSRRRRNAELARRWGDPPGGKTEPFLGFHRGSIPRILQEDPTART